MGAGALAVGLPRSSHSSQVPVETSLRLPSWDAGRPAHVCVCQSRAWSWLQKVGALSLLQKTLGGGRGGSAPFQNALSKEHEQPVAGLLVGVRQGEEQPAAAWHAHKVWDGRRRAGVLGLAPIDTPRLATFGW